MDPVSVLGTSLPELTNTAEKTVQILHQFINSIPDAPSSAEKVMDEAQSICNTTKSLRVLILESPAASIGRLVATVAACIGTFSELDMELNGMRKGAAAARFSRAKGKNIGRVNGIDRQGWARREATISILSSRLQTHKSSLVSYCKQLERYDLCYL